MSRRRFYVPTLVLLVLLAASSGIAWGPNGHRAVGLIAESNLNAAAQAAVDSLLDGESLAAVSNWADLIRSFPRWNCAAPFHYANIPPGVAYETMPMPEEGDVLGAIAYFYKALENPAADRILRANALRFLVHFIGDIHQPLHVGFGCDRGGNDVIVQWKGQETRLHAVWDSQIHAALGLSYTEFVGLLVKPSDREKAGLEASSPIQWASESQELLSEVYRCSVSQDRCPCLCGDCEDGYAVFGGCKERPCRLVSAPVTLSWEYQSRAEPIIRRRIQEGGIRLAAVLNWALSDETPSAEFSAFLSKFEERFGWEAAFKACSTR